MCLARNISFPEYPGILAFIRPDATSRMRENNKKVNKPVNLTLQASGRLLEVYANRIDNALWKQGNKGALHRTKCEKEKKGTPISQLLSIGKIKIFVLRIIINIKPDLIFRGIASGASFGVNQGGI